MDDDQKLERLERTVKETLRLAKENNRRIRGIQRGMFMSGIIRLLIWGIILGLPIFIYFSVLKPYVDGATTTFENIKSGETSVFEQFIKVPGLDAFQDAIDRNQAE